MHEPVRRLAAIMFTDLEGFTSLAQVDEPLALAIVERQHQLVRPVLSRFRGREVKTMGDGLLVEFDSALDATRSAVEIQRVLAEHNRAAPEAERIRMRIGIHLGDVMHTDGDVLGDAVNVASRMEPLAEAGGICVSEQVYAQVRNKLPLAFERLERPELKHVLLPMEVYRVVLGRDTAAAAPPRATPRLARRLAVLPFANLSPDPDDEFFADGLTEEMIAELSGLAGLEVIARTSVMRYKGGTKSIREVGRDLDVDVVLEGSVRKASGRIRVTAQLIDAASEGHLWADRFDRELTDIFAVQTEIAQRVAKRLGVTFGSVQHPAASAEADLEAYVLYLKGRFLWNRRTPSAVRQALELFEEAVARAPAFAAAHSGIADAWLILTNSLEEVGWAESGPRARAAASRAVELDEALAEGHASLGLVLMTDFAWSDAERELRRSIEVAPAYAPAHVWYFRLLVAEGRMEEAHRELARAAELDPLSPVVAVNLAFLARFDGRLDEAIRQWDRLTELEPGFSQVLPAYKPAFLLAQGKQDAARAAFRSLEAVWKSSPTPLEERFTWTPAVSYALVGEVDEARRSLERLHRLAATGYVPSNGFAFAYAALGERDAFFEWFGRAIDDHSADLFSLRLLPFASALREDPRYAELFRRAGLST